jgi:hypothetical protein
VPTNDEDGAYGGVVTSDLRCYISQCALTTRGPNVKKPLSTLKGAARGSCTNFTAYWVRF